MPKALVIGGGIGGLAAAIALRHAGFDVEVFERGTQMQDAGAGLSLWANAIHALDALGLSGWSRRRASPTALADCDPGVATS